MDRNPPRWWRRKGNWLLPPVAYLAGIGGGSPKIDLQLVKDWNAFARAQPFWVRERSAAT